MSNENYGMEAYRTETFKQIRKVVGGAVHHAAIQRLVDMYPMAQVKVEHTSDSYDGMYRRITVVTIAYEPGEFKDRTDYDDIFTGSWPRGMARCLVKRRLPQTPWEQRHNKPRKFEYIDQFDRKRGIKIAFNRALKTVPRP